MHPPFLPFCFCGSPGPNPGFGMMRSFFDFLSTMFVDGCPLFFCLHHPLFSPWRFHKRRLRVSFFHHLVSPSFLLTMGHNFSFFFWSPSRLRWFSVFSNSCCIIIACFFLSPSQFVGEKSPFANHLNDSPPSTHLFTDDVFFFFPLSSSLHSSQYPPFSFFLCN